MTRQGEKVEIYIRENHGFHILLNNTGGPKGGPIFSAEINEFESAFTQHLKCNHVLAQTIVPFMKSEGCHTFVETCSRTAAKVAATGGRDAKSAVQAHLVSDKLSLASI